MGSSSEPSPSKTQKVKTKKETNMKTKTEAETETETETNMETKTKRKRKRKKLTKIDESAESKDAAGDSATTPATEPSNGASTDATSKIGSFVREHAHLAAGKARHKVDLEHATMPLGAVLHILRERRKDQLYLNCLWYFIFILLYTIVVNMHHHIFTSFSQNYGIRDVLLNEPFQEPDDLRTYHDVGEVDEWWLWFEGPFAQKIWATEWYQEIHGITRLRLDCYCRSATSSALCACARCGLSWRPKEQETEISIMAFVQDSQALSVR